MNRLTTTKAKPNINRIVGFTIVMELGSAYGDMLRSLKTISPDAVTDFEDRTFPQIEAAVLKLFGRAAMDVFIAATLRAESQGPLSAAPVKRKRSANRKPGSQS